MSNKKSYIKQKANARLRRLNLVLQALMYLMIAIVLYDSFVQNTPLFYMLFYLAGLFVGRVYKRLLVVKHETQGQKFILIVSRWDILLTAALILIRFVYGVTLLESIHIIWTTDALYLFFIGIYRSKWKGIVKQIDEIVYQWVASPTTK